MSNERPLRPELLVPQGTQVVSRVEVRAGDATLPRGAVGVVVDAPVDATHAYRVRFPDGTETSLRRSEFSIRRSQLRADLQAAGAPLDEHDLSSCVIFRCVIGSRAYGLDEPGSDTDRRGIYLPPAELQWSLFGVPEQLENDDTQECYWELQKFLKLALQANPNVLECLYSPLVELATPLAQELVDRRRAFLSRLVYQTYSGYVMSQFRRLEQDLRTRGSCKWKHVMHLVRLLLSGLTALREGHVPVRVVEHRDRLLAIRRGETTWEDVNVWRLALHREFDAALAGSPLPERPDFAGANDFLVRARRFRALEHGS
ncbi:MAG: nucleotidyltransferase domain-containing protein [Planctomycetes bacterium]|nr:nucleotidyltransferase domain-containing protein [Planctomycetota bacterium]